MMTVMLNCDLLHLTGTTPPSVEQQQIVDAVVHQRYNVTVDAVAGSGKTTTTRHVVDALREARPDACRTLMVTYSRRLKDDAEAALSAYDTVHVHTYHSFAGSQYDGSSAACHDDVAMTRIVQDDREPVAHAPLFDLIIVDEVQDMTAMYFRLIVKTAYDHYRRRGALPQLLFLGDGQQAIYGFQGADARYLSHAPAIWQKQDVTRPGWKELTLHQSFRVSRPNARFINALTRHKATAATMHSTKEGKAYRKPRYVICNPYNPMLMLHEVTRCLQLYAPEEVFVLAPSVRGSRASPVKKLANMLTDMGVPLCVTCNDAEVLSPAVMRGKLVLTTFHQSKGLERKAVVVIGLDASYFEYFDATSDMCELPNTGYVALTRALEMLVVVQSCKHEPMACVKAAGRELFALCDVLQLADSTSFDVESMMLERFPTLPPPKQRTQSATTRGKDVCEALRFLPSEVAIAQLAKLDVTVARPKQKLLKVSDTTASSAAAPEDGKGDTREGVADITGTAIPIDYQLHAGIPLDEECARFFTAESSSSSSSSIQLLSAATAYCAHRSSLLYKKAQIREYTWLTDATRQAARQRMYDLQLSENAVYEMPMRTALPNKRGTVNGVADAIDASVVYEFKFASALTTEHVLQLVCYMHMYHEQRGQHPSDTERARGVLYNIRSDEQWTVEASTCTLSDIWEALHTSYSLENTSTDDVFVAEARMHEQS
jgi:hypothetical protein